MAERAAQTQAQRSETSRRTILDAAIKVIANDGYRRLTFERLSQETGLSRGLVSYHFRSKVRLMEAIVTTIRSDMAAHLSDAGVDEIDGLHAIMALLDTYLDRVENRPARAFVILTLATESVAEAPELRAAVRDQFEGSRSRFQQWVVRGQQDGSIRLGVDPRGVAGLLQSILRGAALQMYVDPDSFDVGPIRQAAMDLVRSSLAATADR